MDVSFDEKRLIEIYRRLTPDHKEAVMVCASTLAGYDDKTVDERGGHNRPRVINLVERRATI
jgi:hypothetical protein